MKPVLIAPFLLLAALPAQAQTIVSAGNRLGYECYVKARFGTDDRGGLEACNLALRRETLNIRDRAATFGNRGVLLDRLGRSGEAEADFTHAIALNPDLGDPYVNRGAVLIRRQAYDEALAQIERGMALGTSFPQVGEYNRAVALQMMGRIREAYDGYRKALALEPGFTQAAERLKDFTVTRQPATPVGSSPSG